MGAAEARESDSDTSESEEDSLGERARLNRSRDDSESERSGPRQRPAEAEAGLCPCCFAEKGAKEVLRHTPRREKPPRSVSRSSLDPSTVGSEDRERWPQQTQQQTPQQTPQQTLEERVAEHKAQAAAQATKAPEDDVRSEAAVSVRSGVSARSDFSVRTAVVAEQAGAMDAAKLKASLKVFVQSMVRGKELRQGADLKPRMCKLSKAVDALVLADPDQEVPLGEILYIHRGLEALPLQLGIDLDNCWVVLELSSGAALSFHLGDASQAEDFTLFMRLLSSMRRQKSKKEAPRQQAEPEDDARSEASGVSGVSVQSAVMKKTMSTTETTEDPKQVKKMYKMFVETMYRGRDFYILQADGRLLDVDCALTRDKETFRMRWEGAEERRILLSAVLQLRSAKEAKALKLGLGGLDRCCATMELEGGECITFKFGHEEACDRFILCMRILVDQKRQCFNFGAAASSPSKAKTAAKAKGKVRATNTTQVLIESFVRQMLKGCELNVASAGGKQKVTCFLDPAVHVGEAAAALKLGIPMDHLSAVLEMKSGDCLTLCFPKSEERDRFAICVRIFAAQP
ncbi:unnamed protein product [Effrenium voratum]|nr:unnamed protein product [Effrenium voratum]